jgi:WD40 repeat protein
VNSATFSPDGSRIVTASGDKTARIWDAASAKQIAVLRGHDREVNSAAFSPDGSRIVTASGDKTARIWDAASAKQIAVLRGHESAVRSAAFSPDGSRIVTASEDGTARIWDAASAKEIAVLPAPYKGTVWSAAFSPDGSRVVTASWWGKTARIWDAASAKAPDNGWITPTLTVARCAKPGRIMNGDRTNAAVPPAVARRRVKAPVITFLRPDMFPSLTSKPNRQYRVSYEI